MPQFDFPKLQMKPGNTGVLDFDAFLPVGMDDPVTFVQDKVDVAMTIMSSAIGSRLKRETI